MCAIAGIHDPEGVNPRDVARMAETLAHRGPDGHGLFAAPTVALAHRRLAVIDLAGGAQPMGAADGRLQLVANAEIYNHRALREELAARGHRFSTRADVEVILRGYEEWGVAVVERLEGMFAFALWDARGDRLLLARDRFGEKPLYYRAENGRLEFASELRALLGLRAERPALDPEGLGTYLAFDFIPAPRSVFRGVRKLGPAERLVFESGRERIERYWELDSGGGGGLSLEDATAELRRLVDGAVERQLQADVPVGVLLSGGIDSTILASTAVRHRGRLPTFSIGFDQPGGYDESAHARRVAEWLGTEHHEIRFDPASLPSLLAEASAACDEPLADPAVLPLLVLTRLARRSVVVALSGDGADELFAGYDNFAAQRLDEWTRPLDPLKPAAAAALASAWARAFGAGEGTHFGLELRLRQFARGLSYPPPVRGLAWLLSHAPEEVRALSGGAFDGEALLREAAELPRSGSPVNALSRLFLRYYLEGDILPKTDRTSMAVGLEVRCPYLDPALATFAAQLPDRWKLRGLERKWLLKKAMADRLGPAAGRGKHGLQVPTGRLLNHELKGWADEVLLDPAVYRRLPFDRALVEKQLRLHREGRSNRRKPLWNLLVLFLWVERWLG